MQISKEKFVTVLYDYKMVIILVLMIIGLSLASDVFLTSRNLVNVLRQICVNTIIAVGMTFCIITGGIDLSSGAILAVSGVIAAALIKGHICGGSVFVVTVIATVAGGFLGFLNGFSIAKLKVPPFISTLAMMQSARGVAYLLSNGRPIVGLPENFLVIGQGSFLGIPVMVLLMLAVVIVGYILLHRVKIGRYIFYVGGNEEAARVSGIRVSNVLFFAYTMAGLCAGFAGVVLASRINSGQPQAGISYELYAIAAAVIGGTSLSGGIGTIGGTVIGACIIGLIRNGMNLLGVSPFNQLVVLGIVILLAVILDMQSSKKLLSK